VIYVSKRKVTIELTERDIELLKILSEHVAVRIDNVGRLYQTERYHDLRLQKLSKAKYIKRDYGYVFLGIEGERYLKSIGITPKAKPPSKSNYLERVKQRSDLYFDFLGSPWRFIDGRELKKQYGSIDRSSMFIGLLSGWTEYMVYFLTKYYDKKQIENMKHEISNLYRLGIYRAVIFYRDRKERERYRDETLGIKEQLLLPYSVGVELLKKHGEKDIVRAAVERVYGELREPAWKEADFEAEGKQIMVLILNDIEKKAKIRNYLELTAFRHTGRQKIEILCLEEQEEVFREEFPECSIRTISTEEVLRL
jgi:hypothetical protein